MHSCDFSYKNRENGIHSNAKKKTFNVYRGMGTPAVNISWLFVMFSVG